MADEKKPNIFNKIVQAGEAQLDQIIAKAKSKVTPGDSGEDADPLYQKSVYKDISYTLGTQGYQEKAARLSYYYLKQMSMKNSIIVGIIQYYQNRAASFSKPVKHKHERGYRIVLKNEKKFLDEIMEELFGSKEQQGAPEKVEDMSQDNKDIIRDGAGDQFGQPGQEQKEEGQDEGEEKKKFGKANPFEKQDGEPEGEDQEQDPNQDFQDQEEGPEEIPRNAESHAEMPNSEDHVSEREKHRMAKDELRKRTEQKIEAIAEMIQHCGHMDQRPFETQKWTFDAALRAWTRDTFTYDQFSTEKIFSENGELHHWVPMDGSTIRYSTPELKNYKNLDVGQAGYDILYPEKELEALEENEALHLDPEKLENNEFKWVQVINGRIVRAFTADEMAVGMRNPTTDIYANGYSLAELELLLGIVSSHIFTENYNKSYFTQGFSAKGILHIKAAIPRRKLESFRVMWNHMIKGNRNSFQTPIMAGAEEVEWIPLTQNHTDIEFSLWMQYLIRVMCSVYQVDPFEIGFGMREMGDGGGSLSGDNSQVKVDQSQTKGLAPLLRYFEDYINHNFIDEIDPDFKLEFVGISDESMEEALQRQEREIKFKKTLNEIREEDNLPPIPGADDLILDPTYWSWFQSFHPDAKNLKQENMAMFGMPDPNKPPPVFGGDQEGDEDSEDEDGEESESQPPQKGKNPFAKSIVVEYNNLKE